ncbi:zinc-dependent peptidase [Engelhardtia mirabilis]|uniref:Protein MtfA n=1 Tax=Engelhardtia mirabilis TaxID=2528011 RepID=A0A518BEA5_9BACT|nr:Protein MtfA [Planctomycetes bacterium Pla133]QDU99645.1 Protein MtfA [Planctomycetes bacterium Pla86]
MPFGWWRSRKRRKLLAEPFPAVWQRVLDGLDLYRDLDTGDRARLGDLVRVFAEEKRWEGCGGLAMTDEVRVVISAQACRMILRLDHEYYRRVRSILVYPAAYRQRSVGTRGGAVNTDWSANAGESWSGGPIVLSWADVERGEHHSHDGRNLVYHEFAHALDCLDGWADGIPPTVRGVHAEWERVVARELEALRDDVAQGHRTLLDPYGATNPAEFFAVSTECFFERPRDLRHRHPELYGLLADFYRQDLAGAAQ